jgi:TetR/AcrR family transcriptional regulator, transcriptional repressor of bet genes
LPLTDEARAEVPLWVAFLARAIVEPSLAAPLREGGAAMRAFIAERIRTAQRTGEADPGLGPDQEAAGLIALADGLMIHAMIEPDRTETTLATLDYHIARIFPGEAQRDAAHPD